MVVISAIRAANDKFRASTRSRGLVALFVGATSGIGEASLKAFARSTHSPKIYFVGRNKTAAERITRETLTINPSASLTFIHSPDLTTLAANDALVDEFKTKEQKLHLLVMSQGYLSLKGRDENPEGLDRKMVINYYGRMRILISLLPLLRNAISDGITPQAISILAPGREGASIMRELVKKGDLDLLQPGSWSARYSEAITVSSGSLVLEDLAEKNPDIAFKHVYPGIILDTGIMRELPGWAKGIAFAAKPLLYFLGDDVTQVGEGITYLATKEDVATEGKGANLFLGKWNGDPLDWRVSRCKDRADGWDNERGMLKDVVVKWLEKVFDTVKPAGNK